MDALTFSKRLRNRMARTHISQAKLVTLCQPYCDELGIKLTKKNLSQYYNGQFVPRHGKLTAICKALEVDESYFTTGRYNMVLTEDEEALVRCWRKATDKEKRIIATTLEEYGDIPIVDDVASEA